MTPFFKWGVAYRIEASVVVAVNVEATKAWRQRRAEEEERRLQAIDAAQARVAEPEARHRQRMGKPPWTVLGCGVRLAGHSGGRSMYPTPRTVWIIGSRPVSIFFLKYEMYKSTMLVRPAKS